MRRAWWEMGALVIALGALFLSLFFLEKSIALSLISDFCSDILSLAVLYYDSLEPGFRDQPPTPTPLLRSCIASNATPPPSPYAWRIMGHCARSPLSLSHPCPWILPCHFITSNGQQRARTCTSPSVGSTRNRLSHGSITVLPLVPGWEWATSGRSPVRR